MSWEKPWADYAPAHFEAGVLAKNVRGMETGGGWADPAEIGPELTEVIRKRLTFENGGQIRRGAGPNCHLPLGSPRVAAYISGSYAVLGGGPLAPDSPAALPVHLATHSTARHLPPPGSTRSQGSRSTRAGAPG